MQVRTTSSGAFVEEDGVVTMAFNPDAKTEQSIQAASGSAINSAAVSFPPGSISIPMSISIEEASSIATPATAGHLELDNSFINAGKAVAVTASVKADAVKPFTLSLPIPGSSLRLANNDALETLSVVFKIKVAATDEIKTGVIPRKDLVIADGFIKIETTYFGVYQAVITEKLIVEKVETKIDNDLQMKREESTLPPLEVLARHPVVVKGGESITLTGKNFRPTMTLAWNGTSITKLKYVSDSQVSFIAPNGGNLGLLALNVEQEGTSNSISLVFQGDGSKLVGSFSPEQVCSDVTYFDLNGKSQLGTRNCSGSTTVACSSDGEVDCVTNASFKAASMANAVASNIKSGVSIAGVSGTITSAPANCATSGEVGCVTTSTYKAADITNLLPGNIKSGVSIAGVPGQYPSATYPLAGATAATDLPSLAASIPAGSYEWFKSDGSRISGSIADAGTVTPGTSDQAFNESVYRQFTVKGDADLIAGNIKDAIAIFGVTGTLSGSPVNCSSDGEIGCVTTVSYKAADMASVVVSNIKSGVTIAGVTGIVMQESHNDCSADAAVGCVTTAGFPAANIAGFSGSDILSGKTIAGVAGSIGYCADGEVGCFVQGPTFIAVTSASLTAANIKASASIGGVIGTYGPECASDGAGSCLVDGTTYKAAKLATFSSSDIATGKTIAGVPGSATLETHTDCAVNGQTNCVATAMYKAADLSNLTPGNIKAGVSIAGQPGQYPSPTYPLAGSDSTPDLDDPTFEMKMTSGAPFEWFDSKGSRYMRSGEPDIVASNIVSGYSIFGTVGTATAEIHANCISDGETNCVANASYKAAKMANFNAWDVRQGISIAGVSGNHFSPNNMSNLSLFDRSGMTGSLVGADAYDTIDDYNANLAFPVTAFGAWPIMNGNNWMMENDANSDGICDGPCIFKDYLTNLMWTRGSSSLSWDQAISNCENLSNGPHTDWRLPTQKEMMQAYTNGIWSQKASDKLNLITSYFWTATTTSQGTTTAYQLNPALGIVQATSKTLMANFLCVR